MINDTREGSCCDEDPLKFRAEVIDLLQYRTDRNVAYHWVGRLKLLIYHDCEDATLVRTVENVADTPFLEERC